MKPVSEWLQPVGNGSFRCWWPGDDLPYQQYHDNEWGRPVRDDQRLFEKLCLEGFQAGLSWLTILRKRENFRTAFDNFTIDVVAAYTENDVLRLLNDTGIVRHRGKIEAVINNAARAQELVQQEGSISDFVWSYASHETRGRDGEAVHPSGLATTSPSAIRLSKDLKKRGWKFVGPTTMYSFMQSMGMVNDHLDACWVHQECEQLRLQTLSGQ